MMYDKILFEPDGNAFMESFIAEPVGNFKRSAMIVIPGGGYRELCTDREGEPIALAFLARGFNTFVLHYSIERGRYPLQIIQAFKAIKYIKDNADILNIDPEKIFLVGFSAGGHLAGCVGTMWNKVKLLDASIECSKPRGIILVYPLVTANANSTHLNSFKHLLGKDELSLEDLRKCNLDEMVDSNTSPAFIVHTSNDEVATVLNSLLLAQSYAKAGVKFEMHIFPDAPHGIALGDQTTACNVEKWKNERIAGWVDEAVKWTNEQ